MGRCGKDCCVRGCPDKPPVLSPRGPRGHRRGAPRQNLYLLLLAEGEEGRGVCCQLMPVRSSEPLKRAVVPAQKK